MKFSAPRETLLSPLQQVVGAVERRQTSPILGNVLIDASADRLELTATDSEITLRSFEPLESAEPGQTTVSARKLLDICRHLPESARIDFEVSAEQVRFRCGRSRFTLATLPVEQFPSVRTLDSADTLRLPAGALLRCMRNTAFSMAQQDVRFYLNGMLVEIGIGQLVSVATDGHRLAYAEIATDVEPQNAVRAIVPRKSVGELLRLLGPMAADDVVVMRVSDSHLQVEMGSVQMITKLIDGRFPDYQRVIPTDSDKELYIDCGVLKQALSRASVLSNEKYRGVRLTLQNGMLTVSTNNPDQEEAIDELEVDYSGEGAEIGFNVTYLLDVLQVLSTDNARILLKDSGSSALITPDDSSDSQYVIMPMRL